MDSNEIYLLLADAILALHVAIVAFVVFGLVFILIGGTLGWRWVRNLWLRLTHLICIAVVMAQAWAGMVCPLTTLEMWLRRQAGAEVYSGSFITYWLSELLYYDFPTWVFTLAYTSFAVAVFVSWFVVRPHRFGAKTVVRG